ncbi:hypothetical protein XarjCFBP1022_04590 [Xanthomonas arboricola]|nr:hypothetical protein XarjCFBP1022_04590 [Xanthomonas arboricola]
MPRKSLQGRTCGVSRDGGRARAFRECRRSTALKLIHSKSRPPAASPCGAPRNGGRAKGPLQQRRRSPDQQRSD